MKYRHAFDDGIGKVQDDIDAAVIRDIHGIQPDRVRDLDAVFRIGQKVNLMYVKGMQLGSSVHDTPMLVCTDASARHWTFIHRKLSAIDVEAVLVLGKRD